MTNVLENDITNSQLLTKISEIIDEKFKIFTSAITKETETLQLVLQKNKVTINNLKRENRELQTRVFLLEKKIRKNNIAIFGLKTNGDNSLLLANTVSELNKLLNTTVTENSVSDIYRAGKSNKAPIILEFFSGQVKKHIISQVKQKSQKLKEAKITICQDRSKEERLVYRFLRDELDKARQQGKEAKIRGDKLYINGEMYEYCRLEAGKESHGDDSVNAVDRSDSDSDTEEQEELDADGCAKEQEGEEGSQQATEQSRGTKRRTLTPSPKYKLRQQKMKRYKF